jgi:hypothetical protein
MHAMTQALKRQQIAFVNTNSWPQVSVQAALRDEGVQRVIAALQVDNDERAVCC